MATHNITTLKALDRLSTLPDNIAKNIGATQSLFHAIATLCAEDAEFHQKDVQRLSALGETLMDFMDNDLDVLLSEVREMIAGEKSQQEAAQ